MRGILIIIVSMMLLLLVLGFNPSTKSKAISQQSSNASASSSSFSGVNSIELNLKKNLALVDGCEEIWGKYYSWSEQNGFTKMSGLPASSEIPILELSNYGKALLYGVSGTEWVGVNSLYRTTRDGYKEKINIPEQAARIVATAQCLTATAEQIQDGLDFTDGVYHGVVEVICITESGWDPSAQSKDKYGNPIASGICQFIPTTFNRVKPGNEFDIWGVIDNILSATNKMGPVDNYLSPIMGEDRWVKSFMGLAGVNSWNNHEGQARETYSAALQIWNYEHAFAKSLGYDK